MLRVTTIMTGKPGTPYYSTQFFGGDTSGEAQAAASAVRAFWDGLKGLISNGLLITVQADVDNLDAATGLVTDTFATVTATVTSTGNAPLPAATQGLLRLRTGDFVAGRRIQGRVFIPFLANDAQLLGTPSAAFIASANAAGTALLAGGAAAGDWVVYSRKNFEPASVTSATLWSTNFAVMRSRRD